MKFILSYAGWVGGAVTDFVVMILGIALGLLLLHMLCPKLRLNLAKNLQPLLMFMLFGDNA